MQSVTSFALSCIHKHSQRRASGPKFDKKEKEKENEKMRLLLKKNERGGKKEESKGEGVWV